MVETIYGCLSRNTQFGILERISYNEVPPRVEYRVTAFGEKFIRVLDELRTLRRELQAFDQEG